ncbi:MAG: zf-HC2 domain-containing protein, partial [Moorella sp. (in: Bacteria)]|nr:zf-HC2 domain-containing protein [Moorella sp. (in: firmicutes)]
MNCREARQLIHPWLDGELAGDKSSALREHLAECGPCASELEELKELIAALGRMRSPVAPPEGFSAMVMDRLRRELGEGMVGPSRDEAAEKVVPLGAAGALPDSGRVSAGGSSPAGWWSRVRSRWKETMAVAAAFIMIIAGAAGVAARYYGTPWIFGPPMLADGAFGLNRDQRGQTPAEGKSPAGKVTAPRQDTGENKQPGRENE